MKISKPLIHITFQAYKRVNMVIILSSISLGAYSLYDTHLITSPKLTQNGNVTKMANSNLFGVKAEQSVPNTIQQEISKLQLKGIFFSEDSKQAKAIINLGDSEKTYRKGDTLFSNITIAKLFPNKIVLQRDAETETVYLKSKTNL